MIFNNNSTRGHTGSLLVIYIYIIYSQDTVIDNIIAILYECEMCAV